MSPACFAKILVDQNRADCAKPQYTHPVRTNVAYSFSFCVLKVFCPLKHWKRKCCKNAEIIVVLLVVAVNNISVTLVELVNAALCQGSRHLSSACHGLEVKWFYKSIKWYKNKTTINATSSKGYILE